jgi:hypothetical protein
MSTLYNIIVTPFKILVDVVVERFASVTPKPDMIVEDLESPQTEISVESYPNDALQMKAYNFRPRKPVVYSQ